MTYLALWDNQNSTYMHTGRNATKLEDLRQAILSYGGTDFGDGSPEDVEKAENMDVYELSDLMDFTIVTSNVPFDDDTEF